jgi:hypothetical protein
MATDGEAIRRKAYELWEIRGRPHGSPEVDWIAAELLLRGEGSPEDVVAAAAAQKGAGRARYGLREIRQR